MPERDYGWDYEDWMRDQTPEHQGRPEAPQPGFPEPEAAPEPDPNAWLYDPNGNPTSFPKLPEGFEWYWNGKQWSARKPQGTPPPPTPTPYGGNEIPPYGGGGGEGFGGGGWGGQWPSYNAPGYLSPGQFDAGPAFTFAEFSHPAFQKPSAESMLNEPGFQFRMDQGRKALEASAAGKGTLRSGGTLKDILSYGQNFGAQEYGNVYNRALQEYDTNRGNAFGNWSANRENAADMWGKQYGQRRDVFDRYASDLGGQNTFNLSNAQNDFSGRQRQAEMEFQDAFNRWAKQGDWLSQYD